MNELLTCTGLTKQYGSKAALDNLNLTLPRGRIIGLLGPNGSGKTTLIKLINGLLAPTAGQLYINGNEPGPDTKKVVSYLPERTYFNSWMKVNDILDFFCDFYADFRRNRAEDMLQRLGIDPTARLSTMSKGTKEKVQLIMVMSRDADLYCLDEPIGGVDPAARDYILQTIISNYNENASVLISTHLISDIENVLDDVIFIQNGHIRLHTSVDAIREQEGKSVDTLFREVFRC
ncbi:ATP-binding cassette domain-containing protein [Laedolimicola intestinihominis]|uniref:ABC transporter ATP-binding protein n=1 Tax=Laedolimicola intestinihominis TaxID=3133166 RepID=A0ABV1FF74_9FIRM